MVKNGAGGGASGGSKVVINSFGRVN